MQSDAGLDIQIYAFLICGEQVRKVKSPGRIETPPLPSPLVRECLGPAPLRINIIYG
jgi:hypothetical protein